jgi:hypothetical protein
LAAFVVKETAQSKQSTKGAIIRPIWSPCLPTLLNVPTTLLLLNDGELGHHVGHPAAGDEQLLLLRNLVQSEIIFYSF